MIENSKKYSEILCSRYKCKNMEQDIASDALVYVLNCCGDVEKNFEDDDRIARNIIKARIHLFIKNKCLSRLSKPIVTSLHREFTTYKGDREEENVFDRGIEDKSQNVEVKAEEKIMNAIKKNQKKNKQEKCIEMLMKYINLGLKREQAMAKVGQMCGISPEEMLKANARLFNRAKKSKSNTKWKLYFRRIIFSKNYCILSVFIVK